MQKLCKKILNSLKWMLFEKKYRFVIVFFSKDNLIMKTRKILSQFFEKTIKIYNWKDPKQVESWLGLRDATEFGPLCAQRDLVTHAVTGSDDCLYLNVYTKTIDINARQAVMIWIHGGGFLHGCGNDMFFGPDYLLKNDVVLVTINYRLGVLGKQNRWSSSSWNFNTIL